MQNSSRPATSHDGTAGAPTTAPDDVSPAVPGIDDAQAPTKPVPTGLAGRVYRLRAEQAALDGETRMRRLLIGLLIIQVPVAIVMLLSGAFVALIVDIVAVAVQIAAAQVFGPHDGDRHVPAKDEAMEQLIAGQRSELTALREQAERAEAKSSMLAELARRHRGLLVRQLTKIDELEAREADPTALGDLFALDHLATRMRRCSESVLVLSGRDEIKAGGTPVAASEVLRGAVAEIEDFSRVEVTLDRDVTIVGPAVVDVVHLLAELIENATVCSAVSSIVRVHGHSAGDAFAVTVTDSGVGIAPERLAELNRLLAADDLPVTSGQIGFQVVARLAARHGIHVGLTTPAAGGTEATVVLPAAVLVESLRPAAPTAAPPAAAAPPVAPGLFDVTLADPGFVDDLPLERELAAAALDEASIFADEPVLATDLAPDVMTDSMTDSVPDSMTDSVPAVGSELVAEPTASDVPPSGWDLAPLEPIASDETWSLPDLEDLPVEPAGADEYQSWDQSAYQAPFVSYEQQYAAEADLPAPAWEDLAWSAPLAPPAVPVADPKVWRETTQSPFVPAARVVEETAAPAVEPESHAPAAPLAYTVSQPEDDPLTDSGLRRRVPLANMAPQMSGPSPVLADDTVAQPAPDRSRHLFSAYRDGLTLGRGGLSSELPTAENIEQQHEGPQPGEGND